MTHHSKHPNRRKANNRGRPRSRAADQAILRGALELFKEHGIDGVSIEQIAADAGVARTTVYRRWTSKEALVAQALAELRGNPEGRIAAKHSGGASRDLARELVDALAETMAAPDFKRLAARLIGATTSCPELTRIYWSKYLVPRRKLVGGLLERARAEGLLHNDSDIDVVLDLVGGALMYHLLVRPGDRTVSEMRAYLGRVLRQIARYPLSASRSHE